ncbi:hypothetical protein TRICI_000304 [Trichomonascus ciferrii]|uniref:Uncharacterized protein n=1 Tax=Trichomonascus ciferrii TaxID=44093 RepID=A0A642VDP7_9ASCO|nr:hypothetical protein TRICI_000304 [Trichomonascus ciferrii]
MSGNETNATFVDIEGEFYSSLWSDLYQMLDIFLHQFRDAIDWLLNSIYRQSQNMQSPGMEWLITLFYEIRSRVIPVVTTRVMDLLNEQTILPETSREDEGTSGGKHRVINEPEQLEYLTRDLSSQNAIRLPVLGSVRGRLEEMWEAIRTILTEVRNDGSDVIRGLNPNFGDILDLINDITAGRYTYSNIADLKKRTRKLWNQFIPPLDAVIADIQARNKKQKTRK